MGSTPLPTVLEDAKARSAWSPNERDTRKSAKLSEDHIRTGRDVTCMDVSRRFSLQMMGRSDPHTATLLRRKWYERGVLPQMKTKWP